MTPTKLSSIVPRFAVRGRTQQRLGDEQARAGMLMLAPALLHLTIFTLIPVLMAFVLSFTVYRAIEPPRWVNIQNYVNILNERIFWIALGNTVIYAAISVPARMGIALLIAVLLNQMIPFRTFFRAAVYLPQVTSIAAISIVWMWLYNPEYGLFNQVFAFLGLPQQAWLTDSSTALASILIMTTWYGVGSNMVIFLAGLQGIPEQLYEAARIDGADERQLFWRITLPMLSSTTVFVLMTNVMEAFRVFESIYVMTNGGPGRATTTLTLLIYQRGFSSFQFGSASAMAFILFVVVIIATIISRLAVRSGQNLYD
jgi:multiple sugar transport system permease protein